MGITEGVFILLFAMELASNFWLFILYLFIIDLCMLFISSIFAFVMSDYVISFINMSYEKTDSEKSMELFGKSMSLFHMNEFKMLIFRGVF